MIMIFHIILSIGFYGIILNQSKKNTGEILKHLWKMINLIKSLFHIGKNK